METEDASKSNQELELMEAFASIWQLAGSVFFTADEKTPIAFMLVDWIAKHVTGNIKDRISVLPAIRSTCLLNDCFTPLRL